jgi:hypothetical protein
MFCPKCGQQQASDVIRFCPRCGFLLDGVIHLLHNNGMLPSVPAEGSGEMSPRRRGVRQGGAMLLAGAVLVPILGVFTSFSNSAFLEILTAIAAIICFLGGPLRMIFAALFEEGAPSRPALPLASYAPPPPAIRPGVPVRQNVLPPPTTTPPMGWRRPNTAELTQPPSVTENTTRLLDKEEPREH